MTEVGAANECPAPEQPSATRPSATRPSAKRTLSAERDRVPSRPSAQQASSAQRPKINSNQTKGWSQAIAARPVELEKEIWFKKRF